MCNSTVRRGYPPPSTVPIRHRDSASTKSNPDLRARSFRAPRGSTRFEHRKGSLRCAVRTHSRILRRTSRRERCWCRASGASRRAGGSGTLPRSTSGTPGTPCAGTADSPGRATRGPAGTASSARPSAGPPSGGAPKRPPRTNPPASSRSAAPTPTSPRACPVGPDEAGAESICSLARRKGLRIPVLYPKALTTQRAGKWAGPRPAGSTGQALAPGHGAAHGTRRRISPFRAQVRPVQRVASAAAGR
jgi:hypothetical protein